MTIQDLRATLNEHAAGMRDHAVMRRADAARDRARDVRRRRTLATIAAAAVLVVPVVVAALGGNPFDRTAPVVDAPEPDPAVVGTFAGRTLLDSRVAHDGSEVTLSYDADVPTQWTATCFGAGAELTMHMTLDGGSPGDAPCEATQPPEPQMGYILDRSAPGPHTVHLWLATTDGSTVVPADTVVLAAGVYRLPDPVDDIAGVPVYDRERAFDPSLDVLREWRYAGAQSSEPGHRRLLAAHRGDTRMLAQLVAPRLPPGEVTLLVDGVEVDSATVLAGPGFIGPIPPGRHTVEVRLRAGAEEGQQVGVVWRELVP